MKNFTFFEFHRKPQKWLSFSLISDSEFRLYFLWILEIEGFVDRVLIVGQYIDLLKGFFCGFAFDLCKIGVLKGRRESQGGRVQRVSQGSAGL